MGDEANYVEAVRWLTYRVHHILHILAQRPGWSNFSKDFNVIVLCDWDQAVCRTYYFFWYLPDVLRVQTDSWSPKHYDNLYLSTNKTQLNIPKTVF